MDQSMAQEPTSATSRKLAVLRRLSGFVFPLITFFVLAGLFAGDVWFFSIFSHFAVQWTILFVAYFGWFVFKRKYAHSALCALLVLLNTLQILPYLQTDTQSYVSQNQGTNVRLMQMNIYVGNRELANAAELIKSQSPDVLAIEEFNAYAYKGLSDFHCLDQYPTRVIVQNHGLSSEIALFSKYPLKSNRCEYVDNGKSPSLIACLTLPNGEDLNVIIIHPYPPAIPYLLTRQIDQFKLISRLLPKLGRNVIVMGDFNTSPWGNSFKNFVKETGLCDARVGRASMPSWPIFCPPLLIPIDFILTKSNMSIKNYTVGPAVGSDHFPLIMDVEI